MLGKLIKHEFKASAKTMWPIFIGMASLALFIRFVSMPIINRNFGFVISALSFVFMAVFYAGLFALCFAPLVSSAISFKRGILGDEAYLTMTLPVSVDAILGSRLIINAIWYACTGVLGMVIALLLTGRWTNGLRITLGGTDITEAFSELFKLVKSNPGRMGLILLMILEIALCFVAFITLLDLMVYVSYSIGYSANKRKSLWTVLLMYGLFHSLSGIGIVTLFGFGNAQLDFCDYASGIKSLCLLFGEELLVMLAVSAGLYFVTRYFITHKLNLE